MDAYRGMLVVGALIFLIPLVLNITGVAFR